MKKTSQQEINAPSTSINQSDLTLTKKILYQLNQEDANSSLDVSITTDQREDLCYLIDYQELNIATSAKHDSDTATLEEISPDLQESKQPKKVSLTESQCEFSLEAIDEKAELKTEPETKEIRGHVGFTNILKQAFKKVVKKGFEFNIMVVGESGLGKSTLINSMFLADIYNVTDNAGTTQKINKTVTVEATSVLLKEDGVNLVLTVIDTPGFGDAIDNSQSWEPISKYIDDKYGEFLKSENLPFRKQSRDERVHCCLYFIQPSGHGLKPLDIEFMKRLCNKVNLIPVIGKADSLTSDECASFKKQIMLDISEHGIKIYDFPDSPEECNSNQSMKEKIPFAVMGSNTLIEINGRNVRGRKYPWGVAEIENLEHCDFVALRTLMIRTHLEDLKDVTNNTYYENYRLIKLANCEPNVKPLRKSKLAKDEKDLKHKIENEMREKEQQLMSSVEEANKRLDIARKQIEEQAKELEERKKKFELEKDIWERESRGTMDGLSRRAVEAGREFDDAKKEKMKKKKRFFKM